MTYTLFLEDIDENVYSISGRYIIGYPKINLQRDQSGASLPISTFSVKADLKGFWAYNEIDSDPLEVFAAGAKFSFRWYTASDIYQHNYWYIDKITQTDDGFYQIDAVDLVGKLDNEMFAGGVYFGDSFQSVIRAVVGDPSITLDPDVDSLINFYNIDRYDLAEIPSVYGVLDQQTRREALLQLLFASGLYMFGTGVENYPYILRPIYNVNCGRVGSERGTVGFAEGDYSVTVTFDHYQRRADGCRIIKHDPATHGVIASFYFTGDYSDPEKEIAFSENGLVFTSSVDFWTDTEYVAVFEYLPDWVTQEDEPHRADLYLGSTYKAADGYIGTVTATALNYETCFDDNHDPIYDTPEEFADHAEKLTEILTVDGDHQTDKKIDGGSLVTLYNVDEISIRIGAYYNRRITWEGALPALVDVWDKFSPEAREGGWYIPTRLESADVSLSTFCKLGAKTTGNISMTEMIESIGFGAVDFSANGSRLLRSATFYGKTISDSVLPPEYQQLTFIKSSGREYINTGFVPSHTSTMELDFRPTVVQSKIFAGVRSGTSARFTINSGNSDADFVAAFGNTATNTRLGAFSRTRVSAMIRKGGYYFNGQRVASASQATWSQTRPVYLFAVNESGTAATFATAEIYGCLLSDGENIERNFVPCYRRSDGVNGMYDTIHGVFYTNAGSGAFTRGAEVGGFYHNNSKWQNTLGETVDLSAIVLRSTLDGAARDEFEATSGTLTRRVDPATLSPITDVVTHITPQPLHQTNGSNSIEQIGGDIDDTQIKIAYIGARG